jgi:hypothetical protein
MNRGVIFAFILLPKRRILPPQKGGQLRVKKKEKDRSSILSMKKGKKVLLTCVVLCMARMPELMLS